MTKRAGHLWLLLASTIVALFLCEAILQISYRTRHGNWLWKGTAFHVGYTQPVSDRRQYALRPNWTDPAQGIAINRLGFRGELVDSATPVIVAVGDSIPFGAGVKDDETYPAQLDALLRAAGSPVHVLNAGVPSYNLRQSFDRLRLDVLERYRLPILVIVQAANDISLLTHYREKFTPDVTWANARWRGSWGRAWFVKSAMAYYLEQVVSSPPRLEIERHAPYPADIMIENVRRVLDEGIRFCATRSLPLILLPVDPFHYQLKNLSQNARLSGWRRPGYQQYAEMWGPSIARLNDVLSTEGKTTEDVFFLDTRALFDDQDRDRMFVDFLHYSREGNAVVARALLELITRHHLLEKQETATKVK